MRPSDDEMEDPKQREEQGDAAIEGDAGEADTDGPKGTSEAPREAGAGKAEDAAIDAPLTPFDAGPSFAADSAQAEASSGPSAPAPAPSARCVSLPSTLTELAPALFSRGDPVADDASCKTLNPERGTFVFTDLLQLGPLDAVRGAGHSLVYGKVRLSDYRSRDLDPPLLTQLSAAFDQIRRAGLKVIPRFYYAEDEPGLDAPLERVLSHIAALKPLLREHSDVIAVLQPGFVGNYGEWHDSAHGLTEPTARRTIFDALLDALPSERAILARYPFHKRDAYGSPLTAVNAFDGSVRTRIGQENDCLLASADDFGTYADAGERDYALRDSAFVPVGGSSCTPSERTGCASTLEELALLHWSFLNASYDPSVVSGWKREGCFDTIACRLGYRFALLQHEVPKVLRRGQTLSLALSLINDGFARMVNRRPVELVLDGPVQRRFALDLDPRRWGPNERVELCLSAALPSDLPAGSYEIGLALPDAAERLRDDARYAVALANTSFRAGVNYLNVRMSVEE